MFLIVHHPRKRQCAAIMQCPYCQTENRDDQEKCYYCDRDLTMLRLIVNKAKHHFNQGLEFAERNRNDEAITEMRNALDLDGSMVNALVVLGTLYAKQEKFDEARQCWQRALDLDHRYRKAHEYLMKADRVEQALPAIKKAQQLAMTFAGTSAALLLALLGTFMLRSGEPEVTHVVPGPTPPHLTTQTVVVATPTPSAAVTQGNELASAVLQLENQLATMRQEVADAREVVRSLQAQQIDSAEAAIDADALPVALDIIDRVRAGEVVDDALRARLDRVEQQALQQLMEELNEQIANAPLDEAIAVATAMRERRPGLAAQIDTTLDVRLDAEAAQLADRVRELVEQGEFETAGESVQRLVDAYGAAGRQGDNAQLEDLRRQIAEADAVRRMNDAEVAFNEGEWEAYLAATEAIDGALLGDEARERLTERRATALRRQAEADWNWFHSTDPLFADGRINREQANAPCVCIGARSRTCRSI